MGAKDTQTTQAFLEAEAYDGPSLIIAYSPCIAHGYDLKFSLQQQGTAVSSGYWPLFRFNPDLAVEGKNPFHLDSRPPQTVLRANHTATADLAYPSELISFVANDLRLLHFNAAK
jgi:pyruvate-ferredoxin/flavodoxin oxidoreductase